MWRWGGGGEGEGGREEVGTKNERNVVQVYQFLGGGALALTMRAGGSLAKDIRAFHMSLRRSRATLTGVCVPLLCILSCC